ncbi:MAG TPA: class I SAM-dependent methyltransferase [Mycobacteriales bacterium]|jgi:SAM-dependent methyltransferase
MQVGALPAYEHSLSRGTALHLRHPDGCTVTLDIARWLAPADAIDLDALDRSVGLALDVGCGPGRIVAGLADRECLALGIDIAPTAVAMTRERGLNALRCDVFAHVPGEGRWSTIVLLDGNIGIGGDPSLLLRRVHELLAPGGRVIIETHPQCSVDDRQRVRFVVSDQVVGPDFPWAYVGSDAAVDYGRTTGFQTIERWTNGDRAFVLLERQP